MFAQHCASCHATGKAYPVSEIGTDRTQLNQSQAAGKASDGYVAAPLGGIWLRGPYLHNGSVPSLRELLAPQAQRRPAFFPGNDVIDAENVGFLSTIEEEPGRRKFPRYDTTAPGHSNAGHLYATGLTRPDKTLIDSCASGAHCRADTCASLPGRIRGGIYRGGYSVYARRPLTSSPPRNAAIAAGTKKYAQL